MTTTPAPMCYAVIAEMKGGGWHGQPECAPTRQKAEEMRDREQKKLGAGWTVYIEEPKVVQQLRAAFNNRRLRQDSDAISTKDLAAAIRSLGQRANVRMSRAVLFSRIEGLFLAEEENA